MARTHYERLGVTPAASADEIRAAYRSRARRLHPDHAGPVPSTDARRAAEEMAAVNEAWRVLRDPARRAAYDASLRSGTPGGDVRASAPTPPDPEPVHVSGPVAPEVRLLRGLPWLIVLTILALVFVFTAYARSPGGDEDDAAEAPAPTPPTTVPIGSVLPIGTCVQVTTDEPVLVPVPCSGLYDYRVAFTAELTGSCPAGTSGWVAVGAPYKLCLAER